MHAHGDQPGMTRTGQVVILAGAGTFLIGSFLPFYRFEPTSETWSLARLVFMSGPTGGAGWVPGILILLASTAVVVVTAAIGLGERARGIAAPMVFGASATWSLMWVGYLLRSTSSGMFAVGYFVAWVGVAVVIIGTVIVLASMRHRTPLGPSSTEVMS